jgi:hypothetical protein
MSFDLTFNYDSATPENSTWTLANFVLRDWGTDGQTGGNALINQTGAYTWNPSFGNNLNSSHNAYIPILRNRSFLRRFSGCDFSQFVTRVRPLEYNIE